MTGDASQPRVPAEPIVAAAGRLARTPRFLDLAGTIQVPAAKHSAAWGDVVRRTRNARATLRR